MNRCIVAESSMTYAMKVKQLLEGHSIASSVVRLDPSQTKKGCGYGVEFDCAEYENAITILERARIPYTVVSGAAR